MVFSETFSERHITPNEAPHGMMRSTSSTKANLTRPASILLASCLLAAAPSRLLAQPPAQQPAGPATLRIDAAKAVAPVSPLLYGLMTEEINYSYDGGLYAELVQDRTFLSSRSDTQNWIPVAFGNAAGSVATDKSTGPSAALNYSLKLTVTQADPHHPYAIRNHGWWGVPVRPNTTYTGSIWARADAPAASPSVHVSFVADDSGAVLASATLPALTTQWKRYPLTLNTAFISGSAANHILLSVDRPGTVWLQQPSLFPPTFRNRPNGNRTDIMQLLADMHPAFLRFPGGNYLEGDHINERFDWKQTIGPIVDRPGHRSPWRYQSSDGMGLLEFLNWCEDLHMQPLLAVYAGYSLQQEHVEPGPALQPYVQEALDEIEYVIGDASTTWGARRAKDGHPAPFPLRYVEIGNEDWFDKSKSYDGRFTQFYKAIKARYPQLQLISTADSGENSRGNQVTSVKPDLIDDHFYRRADQFFTDVHHYDHIDRNGPKIFVGEWATREGSPTTDMGAALGDAAWMTGLERNSDLVLMASYAPLLVNVNPQGMQWQANLIGYNAFSSYGSPSYYAQVMFANHIGTEILAGDLQTPAAGPDRLFFSATRNPASGTIFLKLVNASSTPQPIHITLEGVHQVQPTARVVTLTAASTAATNSIPDPRRVVPVESTAKGIAQDFTPTIPGYTIEVLELVAH
ncbi:MAG: alpha-L-arabinofuranosidase A [Acidobacteriota bacterium]|nr:alpha-L-arabinofuranosidase A [Acidobacteriota bacterium]